MTTKTRSSEVDRKIIRALESSGTNFVCSVPCTLLAGVLEMLSADLKLTHIPVTREEEGVGICAGAYLGGAKPVLLMQNSGLGNSVNALMSLTNFFELGLFMLIGFRGRKGEEKIEAQIPMGELTLQLLTIVNAEFRVIEEPRKIPEIEKLALCSYKTGKICAAVLAPKLWERG